MATYRLKSKLYGEFDGDEKKSNGILGTGITLGQAAGLAATAAIGMKGYNKFQKNQFSRNLKNLQWKQNQLMKSGIKGVNQSTINKMGREGVNSLLGF